MEKVACRTPNPDRPGVTNIPAWKYGLLQPLVLEVLSDGVMTAKAMYPAVKAQISDDDLARLGSFNWHITTIRLEMEVRGEIERVPGKVPQELRLTT